MFQWVVLGGTVIGSWLISKLFNQRQLSVLVPFCIAYELGLAATAGSIGGVLHFFFTAFNFVIIMVLCHGFPASYRKNNPSWTAFMVFWVYMFAIVFTGYFPIEGACKYLQEFVSTFMAGLCASMWICEREGRLRKVLIYVLIAAGFTILYTYTHGGFSAQNVDEFGRAGFSEDAIGDTGAVNVNFTALVTACFLPFLLVLLLGPVNSAKDRFVRILTLLAFVMMCLTLIRTGSRNGALALIPCMWYFFASPLVKGKKKLLRNVLVGVLVCVFVAVGLKMTLGAHVELRAFRFSGDEGDARTTVMARMTSGRSDMYWRNYNLLSPVEKIIGKGFTLTDNEYFYKADTNEYVKIKKRNSGNAHSIYMALFYRSGFIGAFLFLIFVIVSIRQGFKLGGRGRIGILFMGIWLATGVGEGWGMTGGLTAMLAGMAMGFFTNQPIKNPELMNDRDMMYARRMQFNR